LQGVPTRTARHQKRNAQFEHIAEKRKDFGTAGDPIVKVDTKKSR
jgi:hypothetical protein